MNANAESDSESNESLHNAILDDTQEGVENDSTEMNTDETLEPTESTFDLTLPLMHSYLGQNLEELRGRTILDDGIYMNLPLLIQKSVLLFPGQILPMTVFDPETIYMFKNCIENNRTFGVVCLRHDKLGPIGTTAEIYEYTNEDDRDGFRLKAKGRQRFKILHVKVQGYSKIATVQILPETTLGPPLSDERLASLDSLRIHPTNEEDIKKLQKVENIDTMISPWPAWVYRQYNPLRLCIKIRQHLRFIENRGGVIPEDPIDLSFWVAQNILLDDEERAVLLNYNCALSRLQREIKFLIEDRIFVCSNCDFFIGNQSNIFPMSKEGPQGTYCNVGGFIHETITFYHAQGLELSQVPPSTQYSWFPGYAWTIAYCRNCGVHLGWKFTAVENHLEPKAFWGLTCPKLKSKRKVTNK